MACVRWNESHRASHLPPILLCCRSPPPSYRPLSSCSFSLPLPLPVAPYKALFYSGFLSLSPLSALPSTVLPFACFLFSLNPLSRSPRHVHVERKSRARYTHVHTCSRTYGSKVFARGGQYSPTTRTTPSRPGWKESRGVRMAEEIRFYPAAVAETFFPYLGITSKLE